MSQITFEAVDTSCEQTDRSFITPGLSMVTSSITTIATLYGYSEYVPSNPPKKYHTLAWNGSAEQTAFAVQSGQQVGGAKINWSGSARVDGNGKQVSLYQKNLYAQCPKYGPWPTVTSIPNFGLESLVGYCWPSDPSSCSTCDPNDQNWPFVANIQTNVLEDTAQMAGFIIDTTSRVITPTSLNDNSTGTTQVIAIGNVNDFPQSTLNGITDNWVKVRSVNNYSSQLSEEYTDAEALANALVIHSNGATAETFQRTTGFVSRWTVVSFTITVSNLIPGTPYTVSVDMWDNPSNSHTTQTWNITPQGSSQTIQGTVPVPQQGHTITVRNPLVVFT